MRARPAPRVRLVVLVTLVALVVAGCGTAGANAAGPATPSATPALKRQIVADLRSTWSGYKRAFIQGDGRVIDPTRSGVTTSEGQSYALLRAVWMDDRPEFDLVWAWTQHNLQVRGDHLFGYLWGEHPNGSWSILSTNTATDGDEDIALALIFAGHRWHDPAYLRAATAIVRDIWRTEVATVRGTPYLTAGNWAPSVRSPGIPIDPSYLAPYAYRIFAQLDPADPWMKLVTSSYQVLTACSAAQLGASQSVFLPPNWCAVQPTTGQVIGDPSMPRANTYGYDAFRVMWRVALDWQWNRSPRAHAYLERAAFLRQAWQSHHTLYAEYSHGGVPVGTAQDPTIYGGDIGDFVVTAPKGAQAIAETELLPSLRAQTGVAFWGQRDNYFEQNWVWFGLALEAGQLPNLAR